MGEVGGGAVVASVEGRHHTDPVAARTFAREFHHLLALREAQALVAVDGNRGASVSRPLHGRRGVDLATLQPGHIRPHHVRHAMRIDAANIGVDQHIGSRRRIAYAHAERGEDGFDGASHVRLGNADGNVIGHLETL